MTILQAIGRFRCPEGFSNTRLENLVTKEVPEYMNDTLAASVPIDAFFKQGSRLFLKRR